MKTLKKSGNSWLKRPHASIEHLTFYIDLPAGIRFNKKGKESRLEIKTRAGQPQFKCQINEIQVNQSTAEPQYRDPAWKSCSPREYTKLACTANKFVFIIISAYTTDKHAPATRASLQFISFVGWEKRQHGLTETRREYRWRLYPQLHSYIAT